MMSKLAEMNSIIEKKVTGGYNRIESGVVGSYKKIETGVLNSFNKLTDKCVERLFAKDGESVENARKRLAGK